MPEPLARDDPEIRYETGSGGDIRVDLIVEGRSISRLFIVPFTLRIGAATVRMDGIGGVWTEKECRHRGYARRVLEAAVQRMLPGDAALSMLYGIADFYPKFGFATAGPDSYIELIEPRSGSDLPPGWRVRSYVPGDLTALQQLYERNTARAVGAAVRPPESSCWAKLAKAVDQGTEDCRVVVEPGGQIRAYAWRARWHWYVGMLQRDEPDGMVIAEVMADGPASADAILAACRAWASEEKVTRAEPRKRVVLGLPPEGPVAAAAMRQHTTFKQYYEGCGGSMARVLNVGRLLRSLAPELASRMQTAGSQFAGSLRFQTEIGEATLLISPQGVAVGSDDLHTNSRSAPGGSVSSAHAACAGDTLAVCLPQTTLARLALGAFPPDDLLARLDVPPDERTRQLIGMLFPPKHPHMYLPDRF